MGEKNPHSDKCILLTGASGFAGAYILQSLVRSGYSNIIITSRTSSSLEMIRPYLDYVRIIETDVTDPIGLERAIEQADWIIHAAAKVSFSRRDYKEMMKTNVEGTTHLVNLALEAGTEKLVYISSVAAIGRAGGNGPIDEQKKWSNHRLNTNYALSKYLAEREVWRGIHEGLPAVIINPSMLIGAGYWDRATCRFFPQVYGGMPYYPGGSNGFTDVRDLADMVLLLLERGITGERFICNGVNLSYQALFTEIARFLEVPAPKKRVNPGLNSLVSAYFSLAGLWRGTTPVVTRESLLTASHSFLYDNGKSVEQLGFTYREFQETIRETCAVFKRSRSENKAFALLDSHN